MKKIVVRYLLWVAFLYSILYLSYITSTKFDYLAYRKFDTQYLLLSLLINSILYVILGLSFAYISNCTKNNFITKKMAIIEFIIMGINALFLTIYSCIDVDNFFPSWLLKQSQSNNILGSIILGIELFTLISRLIKKVEK